jgi:hypothetical protein
LSVGVGVAVAEPVALCQGEPALGFCFGEGLFASPFGVAVDNSGGEKNGDVYVGSIGGGGGSSVGRFTATGAPDGFSGSNPNITGTNRNFLHIPEGAGTIGAVGVAVDAAGDVYVASREAEPGVIDKFDPAGEPLASFPLPAEVTQVTGIAVDDSAGPSRGDIYVGDETTQSIYKLDSAGTLIGGKALITGLSKPYAVAVSADGAHVYVTKFGESTEEFSETGEPQGVLDANGTQSVGVDPSTEDVYVVEAGGTQIQAFNTKGEAQGEPFGVGTLSGFSAGLAVSTSTHHFVYVSDLAGNKADFYGEGAKPEAPETLPATEVTGTAAKLNGTLKAGASGYYFQYNTNGSCEAAGGGATAPQPGSSGAVSATATGLEPNQHYTFCVVATNLFGHTEGATEPFTTSGAPPSVDGESASNVTASAGTLAAQINPENQEAAYSFQYATNEALTGATTVPGGSIPAGFGDQPASANVGAGLKPGTTYYYQAVAANATGTTHGAVQSFTTVPEPLTEAATEVTGTTAVLAGTLMQGVAEGEAGFHFEYNIGVSCGGEGAKTTTAAKVGKANKEAVEADIKELSPRTKYTFCLLATNAFGSVSGSGVEFETVAGKPIVEEQSSPEQTTGGGSLAALINPSGANTTCRVKYGLQASYGSETPCPAGLGEGLLGQPVSVTLSGLQPHQTYHYRFLAGNEAGEGEGTDETFKTQIATPVVGHTPSAPVIGRVNAVLSGIVNPENTLVFYHFIYGTTTKYGSGTPVTEGGSGLGTEQVSQLLGGLKPATTYHYALVASNPAGSETSTDGTFRTGPPAPPAALTGTASNITTTSATLAGSINPNGLPTTYAVQIGTDNTYGGELSGVAGSGSEPTPVNATFNNLQPGTLYHYRVLATNQDATSYGEDQTFTTAGAPNPLTQPPAPLLITTPQIQFPTTEPTTNESTPKALTNAQKLTNALKACKSKVKKKRARCKAQAHARYGAAKKKAKKK